MSPRPKNTREALPIADLLNRVFQKHGLSRGTEYRLVFEAWERVVPEYYRPRSRAVSFRNGRLLVVVESAPLLEELRCFRAAEFVKLLNQDLSLRGEAAHVVVREIEFRSR